MRSRRAAARAIEEAERENAGAHASAARISVYPNSPNVVAARVRVWFEFGMKPKRCCSPSAIFSSHELKKGPYLWHPSFHCGRRTPGCESAWRLTLNRLPTVPPALGRQGTLRRTIRQGQHSTKGSRFGPIHKTRA
jgi:hypothetical protein